MDDSVCILYENLKPRPEIEIVEEIVVANSEENVPLAQPSFIDICEDSSENTAVITQSIEEDDSISILQENNRGRPKKLQNGTKDTSSSNCRENKKSKIECGICYDGPEEISASHRTLGSTVCGHIFCDACMASAMSNSSLCPSCRKRLGKKQFHPIYLSM